MCIIISLFEVLMVLACNVPKVVYCIQRIVSFIVALSLELVYCNYVFK